MESTLEHRQRVVLEACSDSSSNNGDSVSKQPHSCTSQEVSTNAATVTTLSPDGKTISSPIDLEKHGRSPLEVSAANKPRSDKDIVGSLKQEEEKVFSESEEDGSVTSDSDEDESRDLCSLITQSPTLRRRSMNRGLRDL